MPSSGAIRPTAILPSVDLPDPLSPIMPSVSPCSTPNVTPLTATISAPYEVGPGEPGELFSSSPYLFSGYWNRPQATADAVRDGWFSAGDIAHRDDEGNIYLVDRKSDKIISGGVNIYPREIEEVLVRHPAVLEAAVIGIPDERWGEAVHAIVVLKPESTAAQESIIEFCAKSIARFKLPKRVDFLPALARNGAGKLLRRELRDPYWRGRSRQIS